MWATILGCLPEPPDFEFGWDGLMHTPLGDLLEKMALVQQDPRWHGEGDVLSHTKLVCDILSRMEDFHMLPVRARQIVSVAALLHDVGKIPCTKLEDGRWTSPGHSSAGAHMARELLWIQLGLSGTPEKRDFRESVCLLVRWHMLPVHILDQENPELRLMQLAADGQLAPGFSIELLCMLSLADSLGRIADDVADQAQTVHLCRSTAESAGCLHSPGSFASALTQYAFLKGKSVWAGQALYDESWGTCIILSGLPGTGKDTWIRRNHPEIPTVCLDDLRRKMGVQPTDEQGAVIQAAFEQARVSLRAKQPFIWNATCLTVPIRQKIVRLIEDYGAAAKVVFLETGWEENLRRNADRKARVPDDVIGNMLGYLTPPHRSEAQYVEWQCT